jgi:hypothetical protein
MQWVRTASLTVVSGQTVSRSFDLATAWPPFWTRQRSECLRSQDDLRPTPEELAVRGVEGEIVEAETPHVRGHDASADDRCEIRGNIAPL